MSKRQTFFVYFFRTLIRVSNSQVALDNELPETMSTRISTSGKNRKQRQKRSFGNDVNRSRYVDVNSTEDDDLRAYSPTDLSFTNARKAVGRPSSVQTEAVVDLTDNGDGVELDDDDGVVLVNNSNDSSPSEMERNGAGSARRRLNDANKFDVFAKHVAIQLKRLPLENALRVQNDMHQLLINERLAVIRQSKKKGLIIEHND